MNEKYENYSSWKLQANINHGLIVQYPGPRIYNEPQGMNLTNQNGASSSLLKKTFWIVLKGTLMSMMTKYITCIRSTKGQEISKAIFLETHCQKSVQIFFEFKHPVHVSKSETPLPWINNSKKDWDNGNGDLIDFSICRLLRGLAIFDGLFLLAAILSFGLPTLSTWFNDVVFMRIMATLFGLLHTFRTGSVYITLGVTFERFYSIVCPLRHNRYVILNIG